MVTEEPYMELREFDPNLGPIAINSSIFAAEYILVQKPVNLTENRDAGSPLWVSAFRRPFQQAVFPFSLQQDVSMLLGVWMWSTTDYIVP